MNSRKNVNPVSIAEDVRFHPKIFEVLDIQIYALGKYRDIGTYFTHTMLTSIYTGKSERPPERCNYLTRKVMLTGRLSLSKHTTWNNKNVWLPRIIKIRWNFFLDELSINIIIDRKCCELIGKLIILGRNNRNYRYIECYHAGRPERMQVLTPTSLEFYASWSMHALFIQNVIYVQAQRKQDNSTASLLRINWY